jgi:hypothetical protein
MIEKLSNKEKQSIRFTAQCLYANYVYNKRL